MASSARLAGLSKINVRKAVLGNVMLVAALCVIACGPATPSLEELVPEGVDLMGQVKLTEVLGDEDVAQLYTLLPKEEDQPATFQDLLDFAEDEIGVDLKDFSKAVFFGTVGDDASFGAIAEGTFEQEALLRKIEQTADIQISTGQYKGHILHTLTVEDEEYAFFFPDAEMLVFGSRSAVQQVVDVQEGDRAPVQGVVLDTFNSLNDPWIKLASKIPSAALADLPDLSGQLPFNVQPFFDIQVVSFSLDKIREDFSGRVAMDFASRDSARDAGDVVDGGLKLVRGLLGDERIKALLNKVDVSTTEDNVTITFRAATSELQDLIDDPPDVNIGDILGGF